MLVLQHISYIHPDQELLFEQIDLQIGRQQKTALVGNNGTGKSTLMKIMAGVLAPSAGSRTVASPPFYVPQVFGQFNAWTVAQALRVDAQMTALHEILRGEATATNLAVLNDDWTIEERCRAALDHWQLGEIDLSQKMETLSGGQKTKIFLAGAQVHQPEIVLLDEPSNHLDAQGRKILYDFIAGTRSALVVVSHDRSLLNLVNRVYELGPKGIVVYGGNYDFYAAQKAMENETLHQEIKNREEALKKARETERETMERQQKLDARGRGKQEKAGMPRIMMKTMKNSAEKSTARAKGVHEEKTGALLQELKQLRQELPDRDRIKFGFDHSQLHIGKQLFIAEKINHRYAEQWLWKTPLDLSITSGERIAIKGKNGSGKTTLVKIILGELLPGEGTIQRTMDHAVYIDQEYSLISNDLTVYEQAQQLNEGRWQEHEVKTRLSRFLFDKDEWNKPCSALSGGEKMRLALCCITLCASSPDLLVLDEPTNNLDLQNVEILTKAVNEYRGTLIVISHDDHFLEAVQINREIDLDEA